MDLSYCAHHHPRGKEAITQLGTTRAVNGVAIKSKLWNLFDLKKQRRKLGQIQGNSCSPSRGKTDKTPAEQAEIPAAQRRWTSLSLQMFGSHSKHENCLFPPPHRHTSPRDLGSSSELRDGAQGRYPRLCTQPGRTEGRLADPI